MKTAENLLNDNGIKPDFFTDQLNMESRYAHLGLFFCVDTPNGLQTVIDFVETIRHEADSITTLVFYFGKTTEITNHPNLFMVGKKDFNFLGQKKARLKNWVQNQSFDLLISFADLDNKNYNHLVVETQSKLKVGTRQNHGKQLVDISIALTDGALDYTAFYQQIKYYLKKLNLNNQ